MLTHSLNKLINHIRLLEMSSAASDVTAAAALLIIMNAAIACYTEFQVCVQKCYSQICPANQYNPTNNILLYDSSPLRFFFIIIKIKLEQSNTITAITMTILCLLTDIHTICSDDECLVRYYDVFVMQSNLITIHEISVIEIRFNLLV